MKHDLTNLILSMTIALAVAGSTTEVKSQAKFASRASGSWSAPGTWQLVSGASGTGVPTAVDTVDILAGNTVTTGATAADCAALIVETGGTLAIDGNAGVSVDGNPGAATVNGTLTLSSGGTLAKQAAGACAFSIGAGGKMTISGSAANPSFDSYSFDPASTEEFTRAGDQPVLSGDAARAIVYGNLTLGGSGTKTAMPINVDTTFRVAGTLTVGAGVTFDVSTYVLRIYFGGNVINYGTIDASVGITVLHMTGAQWLNYGTYLPSVTPGFGYTPESIFVNTVMGGSPSAQTFYDLLVQGTMTAGSGLTVIRNVVIGPGGTLNAGTGLTHAVGGNWTNAGAFNCGTSTVNFGGRFGRTIGNSTFYNMVLNDSLGATLDSDVTIAPGGSLVVTAGNIATGPHTLAIASSDPASFTPGAWSVTGTISRAIASGSAGTYRLFDAASCIVPGGTGNPSTITATVYPGVNPPGLPHAADTALVVRRYYVISSSGVGDGFTYGLWLAYAPSEARGNQAAYTLWQNASGGWANVGTAAPADTVAHCVWQTNLTGFGEWAIGENAAPLPVQLAAFAASAGTSGGVNITWGTASEVNSYGFYVQRSATASSGFADIAGSFVAGAGTTVSPRQYAWTDRSPLAGTSYYRLKQVDLDGSVRYTEALKVVSGSGPSAGDGRVPAVFALEQNYPNPFNPTTRIAFTVEKPGATTLKVYTILGAEVATLFDAVAQPGTQYTVAFDGGSLANGAYFYRLVSGDKTLLHKMLLVK
ncbi:MAG TPA: T9SS type A sorting domain-containing protein [Bacteroidota bacterium]|nr:T9SS type A sorting domain-containing protein [Bacteroidota bacterium]